MSRKVCSISNCDRPHQAKGWCDKHYRRWRAHGDPTYTSKVYGRTCEIEGCNEAHKAHGWCVKHYSRYRIHGSPYHLFEHRKTGTSEFKSWIAMRQRCYRPKNIAYHRYGGRGIKVCERWRGKQGFMNFLADMGEKPTPKHTIDRIDNNGDYTPENCKWSTMKEQASNRKKPSRIFKLNDMEGEE